MCAAERTAVAVCTLPDRASGRVLFGARSNDVDCVLRFQPARSAHGAEGTDSDASSQCLDQAHAILGLAPRADDGFAHAVNDRGVIGTTRPVAARSHRHFHGTAVAGRTTAEVTCQADNGAAATSQLRSDSGQRSSCAVRLLRMSLERASTARDAVSVITELLGCSRHEERPACGYKFVLADGDEAWIVDAVGRFWAARRVSSGCLSTVDDAL